MGPLTRQLYNAYVLGASKQHDADPSLPRMARKAAEQLIGAAHFQIGVKTLDRIFEIVDAYPVTEFSEKLPSQIVAVETEHEVMILSPDLKLGDCISIALFNPEKTSLLHLGHWRPRTAMVGLGENYREAAEAEAREKGIRVEDSKIFRTVYDTASMLATLMELMAEPRLMESSPPPRAARRQAQRELGDVPLPETWRVVSWTVGANFRPGAANNETGQRRPYHLVRGHWRSYGDRHTPKSELRPGHPGWWVWIESHHSGHPDFGVVGHDYRPKLQADLSSRAITELISGRT